MHRRTLLSLALPAFLPATALHAQGMAVLRSAWLGDATRRHGHDALGTGSYPGTLHSTVDVNGREVAVQLDLPADSGFEDSIVRRVNLDGGASDQVVLVRSSRREGAAIAVFGVDGRSPILRELAASPSTGPGRWLNPVGFGDFDGDGHLDVVGVLIPHIGGVLTLYRYRPPHLLPMSQVGDVCNHGYGRQEQSLAAVTRLNGRWTVVIPDQSRRRLRRLAISKVGAWESVAADVSFDHPIERIANSGNGVLEVQAGSEVLILP